MRGIGGIDFNALGGGQVLGSGGGELAKLTFAKLFNRLDYPPFGFADLFNESANRRAKTGFTSESKYGDHLHS